MLKGPSIRVDMGAFLLAKLSFVHVKLSSKAL